MEEGKKPPVRFKNKSVSYLSLATNQNNKASKKQRKKPISEEDIKKVQKIVSAPATQSIAESINKRDLGITETKTVDHLYKESQNMLIETMNKIGLDAQTVAGNLKMAMDLALKTGKYIMGPKGEQVPIPDLRAYKDLLFLWGNWMRVGRPGATSIGHAQFNLFGNAGLDEASKQRVVGIVELLEAEVKRRGLPDILPGNIEVEDAETLPGMVEPGQGEASAPG